MREVLAEIWYDNSQLQAFNLLTDNLNQARCGVQVNGKRQKITLRTFGDERDKGLVANIVTNSALTTGIFFAPYSSTLAKVAAPHSEAASKVMIVQGSSSSSIFADKEHVFGMLPPSAVYLDKAFELLAGLGTASVVGIMEAASFPRAACGAIEALSEKYGLEDRGNIEVVRNPTEEDLPLAKDLTTDTPDVIVGCMYVTGCTAWTKAMRAENINPMQQVFTICIGNSTYHNSEREDADYMMGVSAWDPSM